MTNTQFAIVGKVSKGKVTMIVATPGRTIGKSYPLTRTTSTALAPLAVVAAQVPSLAPSLVPPLVVHVPHTQRIDSPFISMANDNYIRTQQDKEARMEHMDKQARKARIKRTIQDFMNGL